MSMLRVLLLVLDLSSLRELVGSVEVFEVDELGVGVPSLRKAVAEYATCLPQMGEFWPAWGTGHSEVHHRLL